MAGNAALYSPNDPPALGFFTAWDGVLKAQIHDADAEQPKRYRIELRGAEITISVMPEPEVEEHLHGFADYVRHLHGLTPSEQTEGLLTRIHAVRTVLGCVVEPGFDDEGVAEGLVFGLAEELDALVFAVDSVFDSNGTPLVGPAARKES